MVNCLTSFYAGFVIFSVLGFMANYKHDTMEHVAKGGTIMIKLVNYHQCIIYNILPNNYVTAIEGGLFVPVLGTVFFSFLNPSVM